MAEWSKALDLSSSIVYAWVRTPLEAFFGFRGRELLKKKTTTVTGFEPARENPIDF